MFTLFDFFRLLLSALIILPIASIIRESGYYLAVTLLGAKNKKLIIGSGPVLFKIPTIEVRKYFFMYSWMDYDEFEPGSRYRHALIYASPILTSSLSGILVNLLVMYKVLPDNIFFSTFIFYSFYFALFDILPVYLPDGQPTNGRAVFDMLWYGERSDYRSERLAKEKKYTKKPKNKEKQGFTESQEETIKNRDRDQEERGDHIHPEDENQQEINDEEKDFTDIHEKSNDIKEDLEKYGGNKLPIHTSKDKN